MYVYISTTVHMYCLTHMHVHYITAGSKGSEEGREPGDPDAADGEEGGGEEGKKPSKKKKKSKSSAAPGLMIEKDPSNLNAAFDFESRMDPLFQKTAAAFDEGGVEGLLMNNLHVQ